MLSGDRRLDLGVEYTTQHTEYVKELYAWDLDALINQCHPINSIKIKREKLLEKDN